MKNSLQLIIKSEFCRKKNCPKLYRAEDGSYYVQGYVVADARSKVTGLPKDETIVLIDSSLVRQIKKSRSL